MQTTLAFFVLLVQVCLANRYGEHHENEFRAFGNIIISDQYNNRLIEVTRNKNIVYQFGDGSSVPGPNSIVGINDAIQVEPIYENLILMSGTGVPQNAEPTCTGADGCQDNRVILVDRHKRIRWQYGFAGVAGGAFNQLSVPVQAIRLPFENILITDQANHRIIIVSEDTKLIVWQYGQTGTPGIGTNQLNNPNSGLLISWDCVLIADQGNNRVIEVDKRTKEILWSHSEGVNVPAFASRLHNGNTLITNSGNASIIEINRAGNVVWSYITGTPGVSVPQRAVRLHNGHTLISDQGLHTVIEVNRLGTIVWQYGVSGLPGSGPNELNGPYDAKVVGDFTGLGLHH